VVGELETVESWMVQRGKGLCQTEVMLRILFMLVADLSLKAKIYLNLST
jgi:hypothetical protein